MCTSKSHSRGKTLRGDAADVARHYDQFVQAEAARLEQFCPVEYEITLRYLARFIPEHVEVAEVGVGVGHYSEFLARRDCRLHLVDVSEALLGAAEQRLRSANLTEQVVEVRRGSATDLPLTDGSVGAILLLGPLYHLRQSHERNQAVSEAARVLKSRGIVAAAGINRLTFLRDMFRWREPFSSAFFSTEFVNARQTFEQELQEGSFIADFLTTGNLDPQHAPPIGYAAFDDASGISTTPDRRLRRTRARRSRIVHRTMAGCVPLQAAGGSKPMVEYSRSDRNNAGGLGLLRPLLVHRSKERLRTFFRDMRAQKVGCAIEKDNISAACWPQFP